jgi:hypothetical protein
MSHASGASAWWPVAVRAIAIWLPIAAALTGVSGLVYLVAQQSQRLGADEVPLALAQHTAVLLDIGTSPSAAVPADRVELTRSLDPFVLVFDNGGRLLASSATLHGQVPDYPIGVFDTARARGEDRVTWQPEVGVREATVATSWSGGFVVAGRSLGATEQLIDKLGLLVVAGWLATLAVVAASAVVAAVLTAPPDWPSLSLGPWRVPRIAYARRETSASQISAR